MNANHNERSRSNNKYHQIVSHVTKQGRMKIISVIIPKHGPIKTPYQ